jgi:leucyl/phenylalanyl-tRNA--protein transferase
VLTDPPRPVGTTVWDGVSLSGSPGQAPVAVGGALDPPTLVGAYRAGAFPWPSEPDDDPVGPGGHALPWWSPDPRAVIPAGQVRVNRSLRKRLRGCGWTTTVDEAFVDVVRGCQRDGTSGWITDELIDGYATLHALGWAHSVEVWEGDELVGGVYGVAVGGVFAGESMFHTRTDGSKVALADFDARFSAAGGVLLDVQMTTSHLVSLGAREVPRRAYLEVLERVRDADVRLERDRRPVSRLAPAAD